MKVFYIVCLVVLAALAALAALMVLVASVLAPSAPQGVASALVMRAPDPGAIATEGSVSVFTYKGAKVECMLGSASAPTVLVVMVHGLTRDLKGYFSMTESAVRGKSNVLVAGLRFPQQSEAVSGGTYWSGADWVSGGLAAGGPGAKTMSSYEMLDGFVHTLVAKHKGTLKRVVVAGHSAGGQVLCRYAAYGELPAVETFYAIMNPSTYMWLSASRPGGCTGNNSFFLGLDRLPAHIAAKGNADELRKRFLARNVCVMCNKTDTGTAMLDQSAGAMCQGKNRYDRFVNYVAHLRDEMKHPHLQTDAGDANGHAPNLRGDVFQKLVSL